MKKRLSLCIFILCSLFTKSFGSIIIDNVITTNSTCQNNGSIKVYVTTTDKLVVYSIVSGPVPPIQQTNNVFNSLPPGQYTIQVTDGATDKVTKEVTLGGSYTPLAFEPITTSPFCANSDDGKIVGNRTNGTGKAPFEWQLVSPSKDTTAPQANDTFYHLSTGNYTIKLTDGCGSYLTQATSVKSPATGVSIANVDLSMVGCDSVLLKYALRLPNDRYSNVTYQYQTKNGTFGPTSGSQTSKIDSSYLHTNATLFIQQLFPNITYGDNILISVTDACGTQTTNSFNLSQFRFAPSYDYTNCGTNALLKFSSALGYAAYKLPVHYTVVNKLTNLTIADSTVVNTITNLPFTDTLPVKTIYQLSVTDGCGKVFTLIDSIPSPDKPLITSIQHYPYGCLDSVAEVDINTTGFGLTEKLIILSGPTTFGSTKKGFAYTDSYSFPDTIKNGAGTFTLLNVTVGTYHFKVEDDCGNYILDSFVVRPSDVSNLGSTGNNILNVTYKKGCTGKNTMYLSHTGKIGIIVSDMATNHVYLSGGYSSDTLFTNVISNIPAGKYAVTFLSPSYSTGTRIDKIDTCFTHYNIVDTITIPDYLPPSIRSSNSILCKDNVSVELIPDSSRGIPPYQYALKNSQNQTQNSNVFAVSMAGTYRIQISDACGNASATDITVETLSFPPVNKAISVCNHSIKMYYDSSIFFSYSWLKPGNIRYTGDTLNIPYVTPADTGLYIITKIVNIGGCTDTLKSDYHLYGGNYFVENVAICKGNTLTVGKHNYDTAGIYIDTLKSVVGGCDSIIQNDIAYIIPTTGSTTLNSCDSILYKGKSYTSSTLFIDTLKGVGGCDSVYKQIKISITSVLPSINITANNTAVCIGNTVIFTASATNEGNQPTYQWQINNTNAGTNVDTFVSASLNNGDSVSCRLTSNLSCITTKTAVSNAIEMSVTNGNCDTLYVPTAFNPLSYINSKIETLRPYSSGNTIKIITFKVYNRYGNLVFEGHDLNNGWDGRINGVLQNIGTYVWSLEYKKTTGIMKTAKGTSVLIH